jgi:GNAT superfamily N-acetyltransferase
MDAILEDFSEPALIDAIEMNMQETAVRWGQLIGATFHEDEESAWLLSDLPIELGSGIIRTHVSAENQGEAAEKLIQRFTNYHKPMTWLICPSTQPSDLRQRLQARGWFIDDAPGMALDLLTLDEHTAQVDGLNIERVSDDTALRQWIRTMIIGSEIPGNALDLVLDLAAKHPFTPMPEVQFYLGSVNGEPATTSLLFLHAGVAGIYNVATLPTARGHGYGSAITAAPLLAARALGYRIGILQSSQMGLNVYRRMGFQPHGTFSMCMWSVHEEPVSH